MAEPVGSTLGTQLFGALFKSFVAKIVIGTGRRMYEALASGPSFEAHIKATFERCTRIKTLINRDEPVELLNQYVNQNFHCNGDNFDDYSLIESIPNRKRIIISGSGGGGKTIFMKYLWIALFENPRGKIPVFVELRRINEVSSDRLDLFIFHSIVDAQSTVTAEQFEQGIREGQFVFILDGFDEILADRRDSIEKQILSLAHNNPELTIVVSSRADERFRGWQAFSVFHVLPLKKEQVIDLVQKLKFDATIKKKFVERIRKDLFSKHSSFLSNPLLATMMLLTFDQFADIPEKIHLFYEQAFDTLFGKHDATKEAYKRKTYTDVPIDVFKRYLGYFCLATYYDEKFELNEAETLVYLGKGLRVDSATVKPTDFLKDLVESVCTLQRDGLSFTFTHRSFQEFFAAYCLATIPNKHLGEILMKFARRPTDNVIKMLYDIRKELVEDDFLLPELRKLNEQLKALSDESSFLVNYARIIGARVDISALKMGGGKLALSNDRRSEKSYFITVLDKLFPKHFEELRVGMEKFQKKDRFVLRKNLNKKLFSDKSLDLELRAHETINEFVLIGSKVQDSSILPQTYGWLNDTGYADYCRTEAKLIARLLDQVEKGQAHKDKAIDSLLGIPE